MLLLYFSIVGHRVLTDFPGFYVYTASKHAVKVITEGVRQELLKAGSHTRVTVSLEPQCKLVMYSFI